MAVINTWFKSVCRGIPFASLLTCILLTTVLSMAGHDLVTQFFPRPVIHTNPSLDTAFNLNKLIVHIIQAIASVLLFRLINPHWPIKRSWVKIMTFALLLAVINENFLRRFLMEIIADHRNVGYEFLILALPQYLTYIIIALIITIFQEFHHKYCYWIITTILVVLSYHYLPKHLQALLLQCISLNPGGENTQGPYGLRVIFAIYTTYLLPVTGMTWAYLWIKESLPSQGKSLFYFFLLVGVHGQLQGIFQIMHSEGNWLYRIFYFGSFWWELLIAAFMIVYFIERFKRI